ncbi:MAG: hypothetical protein LBM96_10825 [Methanobrevibacter sp.]|nr:hypothetical protein [Candidatus Methanoflexus mossambicus]
MSKSTVKESITGVQVTRSTKKELEDLKEHGDTFNHVIKRLLKFYNENQDKE